MLDLRNTFKGVIALLLFIMLSACNGQGTSLPFTKTTEISNQITTEVGTPTKIIATRMLFSTPTYFVQPTQTQSSTPSLFYTPTGIKPANTATRVFYDLTKWALEFRATTTSYPIICYDNNGQIWDFSPNRYWLVITCGYNDENQTLEIANKEGKLWILRSVDYLPEGITGYLYPAHWTSDDTYLYFIPNNTFANYGLWEGCETV